MRLALLTVCLLAHSTLGAPQRGVQLGGAGGPRPVTYGSPQGVGGPTSQPNFGPAYNQQLSFGPSDANNGPGPVRGRGPGSYQSPQPILLQQGSPSAAPPNFAGFPSPTPFPGGPGGPGRSPIVHLRSPGGSATTASSLADDEEYEEYEDEDEAPRPTQRPAGPQRTPVRVSQPIAFSQGPQRLVVPQQQSQPQAQIRQRQPVPQRQPIQQQHFASQPQQQQQQQQRVQSAAPQQQQGPRGPSPQSYGLDGKRTRLTTPPPIQTVNRYMRQNDDGSITWGYENEDGTFKEETIGADCVVRGKYGYVDPDGQKREYEYQSGNPCDPNKKDQEEEEELPEGPGPQQQLAGVINARPRPVQQQRRPVPVQQQQQQYQPQLQPQYQK